MTSSLFSSEVVKSEIDRAPEPKRTRMIQAFAGLPITVLGVTNKDVGYYLAMNKRSKWLLGTERKPRARSAKDSLAVRERSHKKYGAN